MVPVGQMVKPASNGNSEQILKKCRVPFVLVCGLGIIVYLLIFALDDRCTKLAPPVVEGWYASRDSISAWGSGLLLFYTSSASPAHIMSFCVNGMLMSKPGFPKVLQEAHVLLSINGGTHYHHNRMEACLGQFPNTAKRVSITPNNTGHRMGAVQAVDAEFTYGHLHGYDWVVHMHADTYIVEPSHLINALKNKSASVIASAFSCQAAPNPKVFHFDFFAFRPDRVRNSSFRQWNSFGGLALNYLLDVAFAPQVARGEVMFVPGTGPAPPCQGGVNPFGIWHEHHLPTVLHYWQMEQALHSR